MAENQQSKKGEPQPSESKAIPQGSNNAGKTAWPEVVGLPAAEAERKIKEDKPGVQIQVVPPDHFVTMDFRPNRVRLYVDSLGKVARTPGTG